MKKETERGFRGERAKSTTIINSRVSIHPFTPRIEGGGREKGDGKERERIWIDNRGRENYMKLYIII